MDSQGKKLFFFKGKAGILHNPLTSGLIWGLLFGWDTKSYFHLQHLLWLHLSTRPTSYSEASSKMGRSSIKAFFKATPALFSTPPTVIGMPLDLKGYTPEKYTKKKKNLNTFWQLKYQHEWMVLNCPENYTLKWKWFNHSLAFTSNLAV